MADSILAFNFESSAPDTIEAAYTAPVNSSGVRVKAFTASNDSSASVSYKAYIYNSAGVPVKSVIPMTIVVKDTADNGASLIGQVIPAGGTLRIESSTANALNFYITGIVQ